MRVIKEALEAKINDERLLEIASGLIAIESYPGIPQQETGVAKYIKSICDEYGLQCELREVADGRCNVIVTLDSGNPGKTLMFNAHMDTIPPNGWEEACKPKVVDGILYGRGTCDDKGPIASILESMIIIKELDLLKKGKMIFTGVLDEEENSIGTIDIVESGIKADGAIVMERSFFEIRNCQRGLEWLKFHFIGKPVHSGFLHEGINAISKAVKFIEVMDEELVPKIFARKHPVLVEQTVNYSAIHGGTLPSNVPGECDLFIDTRFLPYQEYEDVLGEFQELIDRLAAEDPEFKCEMSVCKESALKEGYAHLPFETPEDDPLIVSLKRVVKEGTDEEPVVSYMRSWTDAALLSKYAGIPSVIFGPGGENPHVRDESIPVSDLHKGALLFAMAAIDFC